MKFSNCFLELSVGDLAGNEVPSLKKDMKKEINQPSRKSSRNEVTKSLSTLLLFLILLYDVFLRKVIPYTRKNTFCVYSANGTLSLELVNTIFSLRTFHFNENLYKDISLYEHFRNAIKIGGHCVFEVENGVF